MLIKIFKLEPQKSGINKNIAPKLSQELEEAKLRYLIAPSIASIIRADDSQSRCRLVRERNTAAREAGDRENGSAAKLFLHGSSKVTRAEDAGFQPGVNNSVNVSRAA